MSQRPSISERQWWYGRDEPPEEAVALRAGPVSLRLVGRDLRNLRFGGVELAQRVYVAVRDRNWDTVPGELLRREVDAGEDRFVVRLEVRHRQPGIDVTWRGEVTGEPDGTVGYTVDAVAGEFMTYKLIGLNIHHGIRDYAGRQGVASTPTFVGLKAEARLDLGGAILTPWVALAWRHEWSANRSQTATLAALPGASFVIVGARPARDAAQVKAGVNLAMTQTVALFATFEGEFGAKNPVYAGKGGMKVAW